MYLYCRKHNSCYFIQMQASKTRFQPISDLPQLGSNKKTSQFNDPHRLKVKCRGIANEGCRVEPDVRGKSQRELLTVSHGSLCRLI